MYSVSQTFLNKIKESSRTINAEVLINTTKLTTEEIASIAVDYSLGEIPGIGNVVSTKLSLKLLRIGNTPSYYTTQTIKPSVAIDDGVGNWMWVPLGTFYPQPDTIKRTDQTIEIECFDILSTLDTINFESSLSYPTSIRNVANEISTKYKIPFKDVNQLPNVNMKVKPEKQSVRAVLAELAELASANAIMDRDGKLTFKIPTNASFSLDTNNYIDFTLESDNDVKITKLICEKGGQDGKGNEIEDIQVGDTTGATLRFENDSITTQAELQTVYSRIYPMTYTAFELNCQGMPHLEVGDKITLTDKKGVIRTIPLMTHSFTYSGGMLSTFTAKAPSTSSSTGSTGSNSISQAIDKVMADTLTVNNILAGNITADNIAANAITADKIDAKAITADKIQATVIDAINLNAGTATIDSALIDTAEITNIVAQNITVGNAQITDLEAEKIKTGNLIADVMSANVINAANANIGSATINSAKIGELTADKIQAAVIDAINISASTATIDSAKIGELDASKITTGSLTADVIATNVITAINASIGKINADKITVDNIDAGSITTGSIDADRLKANIIEAINISTGKITADHIDATGLTVDNIDAGSITSGSIDTDRLTANVISAINSYAGTMRIKQALIEDLKVSNANIIDLDASKIKTGKLEAARIDTDNLVVKGDLISGTIVADKISGGTLDASKMNVKNLNADSITTGSITIQGENLLHNTMFDGTDKWPVITSGWSLDETTKFEDMNTMKVNVSGLTADAWRALSSERVQTAIGETVVASVYVYTDDRTTLDRGFSIEIQNYADLTSSRLPNQKSKVITPSANGVWERKTFSITITEPNTKYIDIRFHPTRNGRVWIAKPMLSKGSLASVWKPHTDELIGQGAIDSGNLDIDDLFTDNPDIPADKQTFFRSLKAVELDAANITTGKISGERIDIEGLISFEALDGNLQGTMTPPWLVDENGEPILDENGNKIKTSTKINGGSIETNSIKADKIDILSGFTVMGADMKPVFAIGKDANKEGVGTIEINGWLHSSNYVPGVSGYTINTDGSAELNNLVARGTLDVGDAGMTNVGSIPESVRIWAGGTPDSAKFKVFKNGNVIATDTTLGGTLYGALQNDNLKINNSILTISNESATLDYNGNILRKTPKALVETVRIAGDAVSFDTDLSLGGGKVEYAKGNNSLVLNGTLFSVNASMANVFVDPVGGAFGGLNLTGPSGGHHVLRGSTSADKQGTLVFDSEGNQGARGDFSFTRKNYQESCKVDIDGDLQIEEKMTSSKQGIEMRSVNTKIDEVEWKGWGFYSTK